MKQIFTAIRSNSPLPEPSSSRTRLRRAIAAALRPPAPRPLTALPEIARSISGKTWNLPDNWLGLKSLALSFTTRSPLAEARLTFGPSPKQQQFGASARMLRSTSVTETRPIGLDGVPRISPQGMLGMPVALRGDWIDNQTFQLEYNEIANTNTYLLRLHFSDNRLKIEASERTGLFRESYETTSRPLAKFQ